VLEEENMSNEPIVISINRKLAIGSGIAALLLAAFGCSFFFYEEEDSSAPEDVVKVSTRPDKLPPQGFERTLPKDVTGVILVSVDNDKVPIVTAITPKGAPINLCGSPPTTECELVTSPDALVRMLATSTSSTDNPGTCTAGSKVYSCHTAGINKNKRKWHQSPDRNVHYQCGNVEGCVAAQ
jgi:hypothetical protein